MYYIVFYNLKKNLKKYFLKKLTKMTEASAQLNLFIV